MSDSWKFCERYLMIKLWHKKTFRSGAKSSKRGENALRRTALWTTSKYTNETSLIVLQYLLFCSSETIFKDVLCLQRVKSLLVPKSLNVLVKKSVALIFMKVCAVKTTWNASLLEITLLYREHAWRLKNNKFFKNTRAGWFLNSICRTLLVYFYRKQSNLCKYLNTF